MRGAADTVLIVEDEAPMRRFLRSALKAHGFEVVEASTLREAEELMTDAPPDAVLLDLALPDGDGAALLRSVREWFSAPIIVVSARDRDRDKIDALDAGADDYLTKPFSTGELLARLRLALRHARARAAHDEPIFVAGPIRIDPSRHEVTVDGKLVQLTRIEFKLLVLLARHPGKVMTHQQVLREIWGPRATQAHYVRVHMGQLRRKLEVDPAHPRWLITEGGGRLPAAR